MELSKSELIKSSSRVVSIDLLRGVIMVIMALDHCRDFLHFDSFVHNPLDFSYTTPTLFLTRWVTHYCAPVFIFLAGIAAYLYGQRPGVKLSRFLFTRGLWLILLEFTLFKFLWFGELPFYKSGSGSLGLNLHFVAMVIWAIGISMVFLSVWSKLPYRVILVSALLIVFLHNVTDTYKPDASTAWGMIWSLLHRQGFISPGPFHIYVFYPVLPYFGLILSGYCVGKLFTPAFTPEARQRTLIFIGTGCIALFIVLRIFTAYGDPSPWHPFTNLWSTTANYVFSILSFVNTTKYPCSLLFILMTIGPALLFLAIVEDAVKSAAPGSIFVTIGRVPMFYYIFHLVLIRIIVYLLTYINHYEPPFNRYHLTTVYFAWFFVVLVMYLPCRWFAGYKAKHPGKRWLSYV